MATCETQDSDLSPLPIIGQGKQYFKYTCRTCGKPDARNSYMEPVSKRMLAARQCYNCDYWEQFAAKHDAASMTIIDGHVYTPGDNSFGRSRGMGGRRFDIEYLPPSIYAGQRCTTFDLWSGSSIPDRLRANFPDTARFLGGAQKADIGETTCWNGSSSKSEPYPLPKALVPNHQPKDQPNE